MVGQVSARKPGVAVAPIVDLTDDALETATAGEPETEPEKEPETTPAAEDEVDEIKPEETPAPAENADDDPLAGLTDKQRKTELPSRRLQRRRRGLRDAP